MFFRQVRASNSTAYSLLIIIMIVLPNLSPLVHNSYRSFYKQHQYCSASIQHDEYRWCSHKNIKLRSHSWQFSQLPYHSYVRSLSIYLSIHLSIYLPIFLSIQLSVYLSIYLSFFLSVYLPCHPKQSPIQRRFSVHEDSLASALHLLQQTASSTAFDLEVAARNRKVQQKQRARQKEARASKLPNTESLLFGAYLDST